MRRTILVAMCAALASTVPASPVEASPAPSCAAVTTSISACNYTYLGGDILIWAKATASHPDPDAYWGSYVGTRSSSGLLGMCAATSEDMCSRVIEAPGVTFGAVLQCTGTLWNNSNERPVGVTSFGCSNAA